MYNASQFAKRVGVRVKTLQKWDREGRLPARRTISNRRYYTEEDVALALHIPVEKQQRQIVVYCRVSSQTQKADLLNQRAVLEAWCALESIAVDEWLTEIGGGLKFKRKHFLKIFDGIVDDQIGCLIVAYQDRLVRFDFKLIEHLCKRKRCDLIVLKTEKLSPEEEITQDLRTQERPKGVRKSIT